MTVQKLLNETTSLGMNKEAVSNGFDTLIITWGDKCSMRAPLTNNDLAMGLVILDTVQGDCEYSYV